MLIVFKIVHFEQVHSITSKEDIKNIFKVILLICLFKEIKKDKGTTLISSEIMTLAGKRAKCHHPHMALKRWPSSLWQFSVWLLLACHRDDYHEIYTCNPLF